MAAICLVAFSIDSWAALANWITDFAAATALRSREGRFEHVVEQPRRSVELARLLLEQRRNLSLGRRGNFVHAF
jgi:hypothetical protein